jgi:hypothetical protein
MKSITIHEPWCAQQQQDYELLTRAVDDLGAASVALASGGAQGYTQFIEAREHFKTLFEEMSKHYRYVE